MANKERLDITKLTEKAPYQDITPGNAVYGGGGAVTFNTGEWRTQLLTGTNVFSAFCALLCVLIHQFQ